MFFDILTLFPEMFAGPFSESILKIAREKDLIDIKTVNIRDFAEDKHHTTDEPPYGGGAGMVMKAEPIFKAWQDTQTKREVKSKTILMSPQGKELTQDLVKDLSQEKGLTIICGRYEGVDERVRETIVDQEISIGDYVLTGGELPAMVLVDSISRLLTGVLGDENSSKKDSFYNGLLEHPHYTRPREINGLKVPDVLLSGNHQLIDRWRKKESLKRTYERREDLLETKNLSEEEKELFSEDYVVELNDYENIEMLREILDEVKRLRSDFLVDFVIEYDPADKYNISKMKILKNSGYYNSGIIEFDGLTDDLNYRQLTIGAHYNIKDLYQTIKKQFKNEKEWSFQ